MGYRETILILLLVASPAVLAAHRHAPESMTDEEVAAIVQCVDVPRPGRNLTVCTTRKDGAPVLLLHELPGMTPACLRLAKRLEDNGFQVYVPLLFGRPGRTLSRFGMGLVFLRPSVNPISTDDVSPMIAVARDTLDYISARQPSRQVGVIGMCLTGNFGIKLLPDPRVSSAVIAQPALPVGLGHARRSALGLDAKEVAAARDSGKPMLAVRFSSDGKSPCERWKTLRRKFPEKQLEMIEIESPDQEWDIPVEAHAVLTEWYSDEDGHPTRKAFEAVVEVLRNTHVRG